MPRQPAQGGSGPFRRGGALPREVLEARQAEARSAQEGFRGAEFALVSAEQQLAMARARLLQAGGIGSLGQALPGLLRGEDIQSSAKSCIFIHQYGFTIPASDGRAIEALF